MIKPSETLFIEEVSASHILCSQHVRRGTICILGTGYYKVVKGDNPLWRRFSGSGPSASNKSCDNCWREVSGIRALQINDQRQAINGKGSPC